MDTNGELKRLPEGEVMDLPEEAAAYARADFADVNAVFVERLLELAGTLDAALALDLGTGPGDIPVRLVRARPGWRVVAADASMAMLAFACRAARQAGPAAPVYPVLADAKSCPFPGHIFDVVFSNSILHHITETGLFWAEVRRVAKPGAWVLLRDLARPRSTDAARAIVREHAGDESELLQEEFYRSLLSAYTPDEVRAQLLRAGLGGCTVEMVSDRHLDIVGRVL